MFPYGVSSFPPLLLAPPPTAPASLDSVARRFLRPTTSFSSAATFASRSRRRDLARSSSTRTMAAEGPEDGPSSRASLRLLFSGIVNMFIAA